jgi:hypothetical protein
MVFWTHYIVFPFLASSLATFLYDVVITIMISYFSSLEADVSAAANDVAESQDDHAPSNVAVESF